MLFVSETNFDEFLKATLYQQKRTDTEISFRGGLKWIRKKLGLGVSTLKQLQKRHTPHPLNDAVDNSRLTWSNPLREKKVDRDNNEGKELNI